MGMGGGGTLMGNIEGNNWGRWDRTGDIVGTMRRGWGALREDIEGRESWGGDDSNGDSTVTPFSLQVTAAAGTPQVSIPLTPPQVTLCVCPPPQLTLSPPIPSPAAGAAAGGDAGAGCPGCHPLWHHSILGPPEPQHRQRDADGQRRCLNPKTPFLTPKKWALLPQMGLCCPPKNDSPLLPAPKMPLLSPNHDIFSPKMPLFSPKCDSSPLKSHFSPLKSHFPPQNDFSPHKIGFSIPQKGLFYPKTQLLCSKWPKSGHFDPKIVHFYLIFPPMNHFFPQNLNFLPTN